MNIHVPKEIIDKYPTYHFEGKPFRLKNGKNYIRAFHKTLENVHFYCYEDDFFWLDKTDILSVDGQGLTFIKSSDRLITVNDELEKLKAELAEAKADIRQFMRNFEFCNMVLPHALWLAADVDKMLRGETNFVKQSLENYHNAVKEASKDADKTELRCEVRWKDEKRDIAKRLGYPGLEPWCAADKVVEELSELRNKTHLLSLK